MVGCKDYVHAQMGRKGNEQRRIFRQIVRKTSRILDNFYFFQPWVRRYAQLGDTEIHWGGHVCAQNFKSATKEKGHTVICI